MMSTAFHSTSFVSNDTKHYSNKLLDGCVDASGKMITNDSTLDTLANHAFDLMNRQIYAQKLMELKHWVPENEEMMEMENKEETENKETENMIMEILMADEPLPKGIYKKSTTDPNPYYFDASIGSGQKRRKKRIFCQTLHDAMSLKKMPPSMLKEFVKLM